MILLIEIEKRKMTVTMNGYKTEHRLSFMKKLSVSDFLHYVEAETKKAKV